MSALMQGKAVVVTGAGGGIGRELALALGTAGASVVVNDLGVALDGQPVEDTPANKVVAEITAAGGQAVANTDSVASATGAQNIITCAMDSFGRIDGVVNNAGNVRDVIFHKMSEDEWRAVLDVHLNGTYFVSRAAATQFREQSSGAFVHMTSTSGLIGNFGQANYAAAKMGIVGLSKSIALDMQRFGVRSNCIAPFAWSRMTNTLPTETEEQRARVEKLKLMEASKIAPMVVYLLSDLASEVTAQIFAVRANEIMLFSQPRPVRSVHHADGWTPQSIAEIAMPAMQGSLTPVERSPEVINWDPI